MDAAFLQYALGVLRREGASVHILFSFEYVILASSVLSIGVKYLLCIADNLAEGRWEGKVLVCLWRLVHICMLRIVVFYEICVSHNISRVPDCQPQTTSTTNHINHINTNNINNRACTSFTSTW